MSGDTFFTTNEVAQRLGVGVSTVMVWRKRYAKWLPAATHDKLTVFSKKTLETFQLISDCTTSGMESTAIVDILKDTFEDIESDKSTDTNISESDKNSQGSSESIFNDIPKSIGIDAILLQILDQQKKIASAQDRRATAEERKAFALESRAEAELLKANAMQEMLTLVKEQSVQKTVSSLMDRIQQMPDPSVSELDFNFDEKMDELEELTEITSDETQPQPPLKAESPETTLENESVPLPEMNKTDETVAPAQKKEPEPVQVEETDDLSQLINESRETVKDGADDDVDDLSLLIENDQPEVPADIDDLSLLIDDMPASEGESSVDADDLSALIDKPEDDVDDLSLLISEPASQKTEDIDNLSLLIDEKHNNQQNETDDLSSLINDTGSSATEDVDDLSLLIDPPAKQVKEPEKKAPQGDHKSQVLSKIIKMKEKEGLSVEAATQKLNDEGVKTLSGKGEWDIKTITGIYKYIDSGKEKK